MFLNFAKWSGITYIIKNVKLSIRKAIYVHLIIFCKDFRNKVENSRKIMTGLDNLMFQGKLFIYLETYERFFLSIYETVLLRHILTNINFKRYLMIVEEKV